MEDQVQKLTSLKLPAALLNSNLPHDETRKVRLLKTLYLCTQL